MLHLVGACGGLLLILIILADAFETIVLPRRVTRRLRLSRQFLRFFWHIWFSVARHLPASEDPEGASVRERVLALYGPLILLVLVMVWAVGLVVSFALVMWGIQPQLPPEAGPATLGTLLYLSGETFFTLGYGDVAPIDTLGRLLAVVEVGTGFTFLALIIGFLPVINQGFSNREVAITLLDARAGSPPSAVELLRRLGPQPDGTELNQFLQSWERWAAEVLESHLSYPLLCFYRSQHTQLSWLASMTMIMDACTLVMIGVDGPAGPLPTLQARRTFAMVRHAIGDLSQILYIQPRPPRERLPAADLAALRAHLADVGLDLRSGPEADRWLVDLRLLYEPYVNGLADRLLLPLPTWLPSANADDWQTTAWDWEPAHLPPLDGVDAREPA